jgi:TatD DNase family protein
MIVLETDSPYLAPVPFRGKRNEPSFICSVAARVAEVLNISLQELANVTNANAEEVYGKKD